MKKMQFPVTIKIIEEKEAIDAPYVAYIPEFDVSSCGKNEQEAIQNVKQVLDITLEEIQAKGQLDEFLEELGIKNKLKLTSFPKTITESFAYPFYSRGRSYQSNIKHYAKYLRKTDGSLLGFAKPIVIPTYKTVPVFIIRNNLRTAEMTREQYFKILGKA